MHLTQGDLFWGMDSDFTKEVMNETEKTTFDENSIMFNKGDDASHFYVLLKGRVKLTIGTEGPVVYIAKDAGHAIGWSSLVGRETYSATAQCVEPVTAIKIKKDSFLKQLQQYPESECLLYKRLAGMLGERLTTLYPTMA
ncbi:MAG TPA: cyclic nucleotide-binding domain-containing protein [Desulfobacteraceae bacterium]|nr:cyclic nucleotide-binding domain-containing protein [Desulfobacteraceae bacterium]